MDSFDGYILAQDCTNPQKPLGCRQAESSQGKTGKKKIAEKLNGKTKAVLGVL